MNRLPATRVVAALLVLCILVVGGLASAQSITHESHHAHHQKATHGTALCSWMCAAGQVLDGTSAPAPLHLMPLELAEQASFSPIPSPVGKSRATRAPPVR